MQSGEYHFLISKRCEVISGLLPELASAVVDDSVFASGSDIATLLTIGRKKLGLTKKTATELLVPNRKTRPTENAEVIAELWRAHLNQEEEGKCLCRPDHLYQVWAVSQV